MTSLNAIRDPSSEFGYNIYEDGVLTYRSLYKPKIAFGRLEFETEVGWHSIAADNITVNKEVVG